MEFKVDIPWSFFFFFYFCYSFAGNQLISTKHLQCVDTTASSVTGVKCGVYVWIKFDNREQRPRDTTD